MSPSTLLRRCRPCDGSGQNPHGDSSWLFLRYTDDPAVGDAGNRPAGGLAPGTVFYNSPDIFFSPTDALGNLRAGVPVTLKARVFNGGVMRAFAVAVEFWWFNPSLAFGSAPPSQRIGTKIVAVSGDMYTEVECPNRWTPSFVNGGHECLVVQCSSPSEGADDLKFPFQPVLDRHVAQRNLTVTANQPGQNLRLAAGNLFRSAAHFTVRLSSLLVSGEMEMLRAGNVQEVMSRIANASPGRGGDLNVIDVTPRGFGVRLGGSREVEHHRHDRHDPSAADLAAYVNARARANPDFDAQTFGRTLAEFVLQPGVSRVLDFELPPVQVGSGHFLVHRFAQVSAGCDVGGYTVVVAPADFLRRSHH